MYSKQIVLQWIPGQCGVTGNEFAENVAKKGASIQQITRKADPFTSANYKNPHSAKYEDRNAIRNVEQLTMIVGTVAKSTSTAQILGSYPRIQFLIPHL
ncbi:hypothetical protein TNCV_2656352 [Trichonephila clavipes]|nr:hypothetical protein TNCV_2656352 [Trichonephila clavipes]